jgi:glycosyltransferase involved in cell wall biosynthesis
MPKKLVIQIPCFNEQDTLPEVLRELPRQIPGIDEVIVLIIDDGSSDNTVQVALGNGADTWYAICTIKAWLPPFHWLSHISGLGC